MKRGSFHRKKEKNHLFLFSLFFLSPNFYMNVSLVLIAVEFWDMNEPRALSGVQIEPRQLSPASCLDWNVTDDRQMIVGTQSGRIRHFDVESL